MATAKLTKSKINALKSEAQEFVCWDTEVFGFGVRVTPTGAKSYILKYRLGKGRKASQHKPTLAKVGDLSLEQAREDARKWKVLAKDGTDPNQLRHAEAIAPTVSRLCDDYLSSHAPMKRSEDEDRRKIEKRIRPRLGRRRVKDVRHQDIEELHRSMKRTPFEANRVLSLLSKMFSLAVRWGWRDDNPAKGVERYPEPPRERYLSGEEVAALSEAMEGYVADAKYQVAARRAVDAIRLLVLTGARKGEVLSAEWSQFDLERGTWIKPDASTKQKREHRVPLSDAAVTLLKDILSRRPNQSSDYVFPGRVNGHLVEIKRPWAAICERAGMVTKPTVRIHDLRHTYASILVSGGASLPLIGALLGHTQAQTTARYAHLMDDPLRAATNKVGALVGGAGRPVASQTQTGDC